MRYMLRVLQLTAFCCTAGYFSPVVFFWMLTAVVVGCSVFSVMVVMCIYGFTAPMEKFLDIVEYVKQNFVLKLNRVP